MTTDLESDLETPSAETEPAATGSACDGELGAGDGETGDGETGDAGPRQDRTNRWGRVLTYGLLPGLALILALAAGYIKWCDGVAHASHSAGIEAARVAADGAVAMLSYKPDTVERELDTARDRLTGGLKDSYRQLTHDVVIPGSKQKQIAATASVSAAAPVTASPNRAVVLIFVNQTVTVGADPPTETASRIRVTLDKVKSQWLISGFDPI